MISTIILVSAICLMLAGMISGFRTGLIKSVTSLIFLFATLLMLQIGAYIYVNYGHGNVIKVSIAVICLVILGAAFGVARIVLRALKAIANLPIISALDHLMGAVSGILISIITIELIFVAAYYGKLGQASVHIMEEIKNNTFLYFLYRYNLFLD